jgi:hypothetical protein
VTGLQSRTSLPLAQNRDDYKIAMIKRHYCIRSPIHGCFEHHVIVRIAESWSPQE